MSAPAEDDGFVAIAVGLVCLSVCVPETMPVGEVVFQANAWYPTGISSRWEISDDETFATGQPNPCPCEATPGRLHRLLNC